MSLHLLSIWNNSFDGQKLLARKSEVVCLHLHDLLAESICANTRICYNISRVRICDLKSLNAETAWWTKSNDRNCKLQSTSRGQIVPSFWLDCGHQATWHDICGALNCEWHRARETVNLCCILFTCDSVSNCVSFYVCFHGWCRVVPYRKLVIDRVSAVCWEGIKTPRCLNYNLLLSTYTEWVCASSIDWIAERDLLVSANLIEFHRDTNWWLGCDYRSPACILMIDLESELGGHLWSVKIGCTLQVVSLRSK